MMAVAPKGDPAGYVPIAPPGTVDSKSPRGNIPPLPLWILLPYPRPSKIWTVYKNPK